MKSLTLLIVSLSTATFGFSQASDKPRLEMQQYTAAQVREDFHYLYQTLQASSYNLYETTPKAAFDMEFQRIDSLLNRTFAKIEVIRLFQRFVALSRLGHCTMDPPFWDVYDIYKGNGGTLFPFDVRINGAQVLIKRKFSDNTSIETGDELLAINGEPIERFMRGIYDYLSGENDYIKSTLIEIHTFPKVVWEVYGQADEYKLTIKKPNGTVADVAVRPLLAETYENEVKGAPSVINTTRDFRFIGTETAYLHPGIFLNLGGGSTSDHATFDKGEFIQFLDSAFLQIHQHNAKFLIIDLRGNPGGDNAFSDPLVAYFATRPFWYCSRFSVRTSALTKQFWLGVNDPIVADLRAAILSHKNGDVFEMTLPSYPPRTDSLRFTGKVYVLINRFSYSNAATTPAMIQDYGFGKIVGEQTADSPTLIAAIHDFRLPNTKLKVEYPKALMVRPNGDVASRGVVPDYPVADDVNESSDRILASTLKLIGEGR